MNLENLKGKSHRRFNPLTRDWILVSPNRLERPWQGQTEKSESASALASYDPSCYLCPGNGRAEGTKNPRYSSTFVFENDFAALQSDAGDLTLDEGGKKLMIAQAESGVCRVVCFSPRHDLTLAQMPVAEINDVVEVWAAQFRELGGLANINYVEIFENRGAMMGCSNPHPHGQIWATGSIPNEPRKEQESLQEYRGKNQRCLLCDYTALELAAEERMVCQNESFVALVPFWATWPFETLVLGRRHVADIAALDAEQRAGLADILKRVTTRYDNLFQTSFPYSMGFHQRPTDGEEHEEWHFHAHFFPPLLRSATVKKFMVGFEMLGSPQRDMTAESAAERLRGRSEVHYSARGQKNS